MATIIAIPVLFIAALLQITVFSRLPLVHGTADLILLILAAWGIHTRANNAWLWALIGGLMISFVSAVPWPAVIIPYVAISYLAQMLHGRLWQSPILAMFLITIIGTLAVQSTTIITLILNDLPIGLGPALSAVTVPSLILNLLLAIPVFVIIKDISRWVYPVENYE